MKKILETERLLLREFTTEDASFIIQLLNSPGWLQYIGDRNIKTQEQAEAYLTNGPIKSYEVNGYGLAMVELKEGKIPIGMCGIIKRDTLDHPDIGFAFLPDYIGKGFGSEIAASVMKYANEELNLHPILAITVPHNTPSINLLKKIGLKYDKMIKSPLDEDLMLFTSPKRNSRET